MKNLKSTILSFSLLLFSIGANAIEDCDSVKKVYKAIAEEDVQKVKTMLNNGFDPDTTCGNRSIFEVLSFYNMPLDYAGVILKNNDISEKGARAAQLLFDYGANPDGASHFTTPMYEILSGIKEHDFRPGITCHKPRLMKLLVDNGANPQKGAWNSNVDKWFPSYNNLNMGCGEEVIKEYLKSQPDFFHGYSSCEGIDFEEYATWVKAVRYVTNDPSSQPTLRWFFNYFEAEYNMPSWDNDNSNARSWLADKCDR